MDDIADVGFDAKHSFEDAIEPVESLHARYAERMTMIGGVDIDLLSRGTTADVRSRVREILERCAPRGGYVVGTGNSVADYVRLENYLAMVEERDRYAMNA
jgi:uroporphyrinogen decarboxylase